MNRSRRSLYDLIIVIGLFNFFIAALTGVALRAAPLYVLPFNYSNFLHGHSHFAFGGWLTPALAWAVLRQMPEVTERMGQKHIRNVFILFFTSAYGMLFSFPFQGYGAISIFFSTVSIFATFYLAWRWWKALQSDVSISSLFLRAAILFLLLSSAGPFATGPLAHFGYKEEPVYRNVVYFYLHFQYNGWFSFIVFAIISRTMIPNVRLVRAFYLLTSGCVLSVFLSFLWSTPHSWYYLTGGFGAALQLWGAILLIAAIRSEKNHRTHPHLFTFVLCAMLLKLCLQLLSGIPYLASFTASHRIIIIAYLHLVMLGFLSTFILYLLSGMFSIKKEVYFFFIIFVLTEVILVASPFLPSVLFAWSQQVLFWASLLFPLSIFRLLVAVGRNIDLAPVQSLRAH